MSVLKIKNENDEWESITAIKGDVGETGVGVQSIEQTTTSTVSGGTNIITATLTDGTTSEFYIKNGEAGGSGGGGTSDYTDLTNKPSINNVTLTGNKTTSDLGIDIPSKTSDLTNDSGFITSSSLPTKTSDLTNDSGFITTSSLPTKTSDLTNDSGYITSSSLPTKVSDLTNDAGYITSYTETDPVFSASAAAGITSTNITNWNNKSDFSGSYNDLTNKPTIPDELSDLSDDSTHRLVTDTEKTTWNNKSDFSGNYNDLTNTPTIPTVNDATLTIQKNGTTVNTFTANASSNVTANITVPTQTSELTNNSDFITSSELEDRPYYNSLTTVQDQSKPAGYYEVISDFALDNSATVAYINSDAIKYKLNDNLEDIIDGKQDEITNTNKLDYSLIDNTPTIPTVPTTVSSFTNDAGYITNSVSNLTNYTPTSSLATVATSGSYTDLSNKPTIPTITLSTTTWVDGLF